MIQYERFTLANGLRVIVHEDHSTPMVAVNLCYYAGARDESPERTGFAHLFEHLMFGGTPSVPDFDDPIQLAGGESNAFTNNDITNYYELVPAANLELALSLEADRMTNLTINSHSLEVQRKVVVEEFKETCLNEPYGNVWHHLADLAYESHPYRWPTIGLKPEHVSEATLEDVRAFYQKYYSPNNAVLIISGKVKTSEAKVLTQKWFGPIPAGPNIERKLPIEPPQQQLRQRLLREEVPSDALYLAFHMPSRVERRYYTIDLLSDVLGNGPSSRLYRRLLKEQQLFSYIDCYVTGTIDPGLLIIEAKPLTGVSLDQARAAIWAELDELKVNGIPARELQKLKNKVESTLIFSEVSVLNKAINLAFFELLGNVELINQEAHYYRAISTEDILAAARHTFIRDNCSDLAYTMLEGVAA